MTQRLPGVLQEIAEVAGEAAALAIASRAGGTRIYLPAKAPDAHWLVQAVGRTHADALCNHFAVDGRGARLDVPLHVGGTFRQLQRAIAEVVHKMDDGSEASSREIARKVGITQRTVHRHRARHRGGQDPKQGRLM